MCKCESRLNRNCGFQILDSYYSFNRSVTHKLFLLSVLFLSSSRKHELGPQAKIHTALSWMSVSARLVIPLLALVRFGNRDGWGMVGMVRIKSGLSLHVGPRGPRHSWFDSFRLVLFCFSALRSTEAQEMCQAPCVHMMKNASCHLGLACGFCHFQHGKKKKLDKGQRMMLYEACEGPSKENHGNSMKFHSNFCVEMKKMRLVICSSSPLISDPSAVTSFLGKDAAWGSCYLTWLRSWEGWAGPMSRWWSCWGFCRERSPELPWAPALGRRSSVRHKSLAVCSGWMWVRSWIS